MKDYVRNQSMTTNNTLLKAQTYGEQFGYQTIKTIRSTTKYINKLFVVTFGSVGLYIFGFILGLVRKEV